MYVYVLRFFWASEWIKKKQQQDRNTQKREKKKHAIDRDLLCVCIDFCLLLLSVNSQDAFSKLRSDVCAYIYNEMLRFSLQHLNHTTKANTTIIRRHSSCKTQNFVGSLLMLYFQFKWLEFERERKNCRNLFRQWIFYEKNFASILRSIFNSFSQKFAFWRTNLDKMYKSQLYADFLVTIATAQNKQICLIDTVTVVINMSTIPQKFIFFSFFYSENKTNYSHWICFVACHYGRENHCLAIILSNLTSNSFKSYAIGQYGNIPKGATYFFAFFLF